MRVARSLIIPSLALISSLAVADLAYGQEYTLAPTGDRNSVINLLPPTDLASATSQPQGTPRPVVEDRLARAPDDYTPHEELPPGQIPPGSEYYPPFDSQLSQPPLGVLPPPTKSHYAVHYDNLGPQIRLFEPKVRVYFDVGDERDGKLDVFHDGSLAPSINFFELYWPEHWPERLGHQDWRMGPICGVGISSPAGSNGTAEATGAPVLMGSIGLQFEFILNQATLDRMRAENADPYKIHQAWQESAKAGIEIGLAGGVSSDETLDSIGDGAIYVGVTLHRGK